MKSRQRPAQDIPQRKISETFLDFADPIMETLPEDVSAAQMDRTLKIAYTVWNAMVLHEVKGDRHYLDLIQAAVGQDPDVTTLVSALMERKRTRFRSDHRLIGIYEIIEKHGELILRADVRAIPA